MAKRGDADGPDPYRVSFRILIVFVAYTVYRIASVEHVGAGVLTGSGTVLVGFALVERYTRRRRDRRGFLQAGMTILGSGLIALGAFLALR